MDGERALFIEATREIDDVNKLEEYLTIQKKIMRAKNPVFIRLKKGMSWDS
jgi:hypothetical protein